MIRSRSTGLAAARARGGAASLAMHARSAALAAEDAQHFPSSACPALDARLARRPCCTSSAQGNHRLYCADGHEYPTSAWATPARCSADARRRWRRDRRAGLAWPHRDAAVHARPRSAASRTLLSPARAGQIALPAPATRNCFVLRWARARSPARPRVLVFDGCYHGTVDDTLVDMDAQQRTLTRASLLGGARSRARHGGRSLSTTSPRWSARWHTRRRGLRADRAGADELRPGAAAAGFSRATAARAARARLAFGARQTHTVSSGWRAGIFGASRNSTRLHGDRQGDRRWAALARYTASAKR